MDYDQEGDETPVGVQTPIDDLDSAQLQLVGGITNNPSILMQLQQQSAAEELADL